MTGECVLVSGFSDAERLKAVKLALMRLGVRIREVTPEQYNQPIGALLHIKGIEAAQEPCTDTSDTGEMLVLYGFGDARLDLLLRTLKKAGLTGILKAVVTPYNILWDVRTLFAELTREHEAMSGQ